MSETKMSLCTSTLPANDIKIVEARRSNCSSMRSIRVRAGGFIVRKFLIASVVALLLCAASVGSAQSRAKERKITDRDVFLHFRLGAVEELSKRAGDPCSGAGMERLECRPVALELVNQSSQTLHLFHMSCGVEFSVEQQLPDGKWQSTQVPALAPGIDDLEMCI